MDRFLTWWHDKSRAAQIAMGAGTVIFFFLLLVAVLPIDGNSDKTNAATQPPPPAAAAAVAVATKTRPPKPAKPRPRPRPKPRDRVRAEIGSEVDASGYAGTLEVQNLDFSPTEAEVTVTTPEGGFQGTSCHDLDEGAQAVFQKVYENTGWRKGAVLVYKGGLVDSSTGQELPDVNTGIFTMPAGQARQIDWYDDDTLLNIDWSLYRDFCHPALKQ